LIKLGIGYSFFDSAKEIPRALDPIYKHVWKIYGINGRYSLFKADHDYSNDGSKELVLSYPNAVVEDFCGHQHEKRQRYLDLAGEDGCEFLMVLDSDEYLHPDYQNWDMFYRNLERMSRKYYDMDCFTMRVFLSKAWEKAHNKVMRGRFRKYVRIHRNPGMQRYALGTHYFFARKTDTEAELIRDEKPFLQPTIEHYDKYLIDGIRLQTDSTMRNQNFLDARDGWAYDTIEDEEKYRYFLWVKYCRPIIFEKYPHLVKDEMMKRLP